MFEEFWAKYPRKVAKLEAQKAWNKMTPDQRSKAIEAIPAHARRWDDLHFVPHAASWLRGERFLDELPEQYNTSPKLVQIAWWSSTQGIIDQGAKLGLQARPGESESAFKQRIVSHMQRAA